MWIVFCWLLLDPRLGKGDFDGEPYSSAHNLGNEIGPVALGVAISFVAYLIGTGANELRGLVSRAYIQARQSTTPSLGDDKRQHAVDGQAKASESGSWRQSWATWKGRKTSAPPEEASPPKASLGSALQRQLETVNQLLGPAMRTAAKALSQAAGILVGSAAIGETLGAWIARQLIKAGADPYRRYLPKRAVASLDRYLKDVTPSGDDNRPDAADVIADFPVLRMRLIHHSPDTASEVDRLNGEADFRSAIVLPLLAIAAVFAVEVSLLFLLAWPLLLALRMTARQRRYEAGELMVDALSQRLIQAPCVEAYLAGS